MPQSACPGRPKGPEFRIMALASSPVVQRHPCPAWATRMSDWHGLRPGCVRRLGPTPASWPNSKRAPPVSCLQLGMGSHGGVEVIHIGLVVLVVMQVHGLGVEVRLQRVICVRQRRQGEGPGWRCGWGCGWRLRRLELHWYGGFDSTAARLLARPDASLRVRRFS